MNKDKKEDEKKFEKSLRLHSEMEGTELEKLAELLLDIYEEKGRKKIRIPQRGTSYTMKEVPGRLIVAKQSEHHEKTTEYVDHGAPDHDDKVQWDKDESGKLAQEKEHVEKGEGGHITQDKTGQDKEKK